MAGLILPRAVHRMHARSPVAQREALAEALAARKMGIAARTWTDSRPLHILAGDSHIELGNWYDLFGGALAVRSCGLSRATIADVTELITAIPDRRPRSLVLMCGINNLGRNDPVPLCIQHYEKLLRTARAELDPERLFVVAVMPVRESRFHSSNRTLNQAVSTFNERLKDLCRQHRAVFVNLDDVVTEGRAELSGGLTDDGLHLNQAGYRRVAAALREHLATRPDGKE